MPLLNDDQIQALAADRDHWIYVAERYREQMQSEKDRCEDIQRDRIRLIERLEELEGPRA